MLEAFGWGVFAAGSLVLGAVYALLREPHLRTLGLVMGFGAGVLLSAVSFELVEEAVTVSGGAGGAALGFFAGALVFLGGDYARASPAPPSPRPGWRSPSASSSTAYRSRR
jgi:zinc transporter, ZIP family